MSIYKDSYETTVGSVFVTKTIKSAIEEAIIRDNIDRIQLGVTTEGPVKPLFVTGLHPSEAGIPLFSHPITIFTNRGGKYLCTDLRFYVRNGATQENFEDEIKNRTEYNFSKSRAVLNLIWVNDGPGRVKNGLQFAGTVFAGWLSDTISKAFALDFKDQTTLAVISSFYYQTLFADTSEFDEDAKQKMAIHTIKATKAQSAFVFEIFDKIGKLENIDDYCSTVTRILENVRLKNFNLPVLLTLVRNSWYGTNSKEIISVALEHPPTWCAIVYTALNERTYKTSSVYRIAEKFGKQGVSDEFNKTYISMIKENLAREELQLDFKLFE